MVPRYNYLYVRDHGDDDYSRSSSDDDDYDEHEVTSPLSIPIETPDPMPTTDEDSWTKPVAWSMPHPTPIPSSTQSPSTETAPPYTSHSALPDDSGASSTRTSLPSNELPPSSTATGGYSGYSSGHDQQKHSNNGPIYAAAVIVPIAVLAIIGAAIFFCMRKRKKQRQIAATQAQMQEMKSRSQPSAQPYLAPPMPPPTHQPSYTAPPLHPPPASPTAQPVILGPISAGSNGNYFTGIDTSDVVSVRNERTGLGDPFADGSSLNEEPPPPYRPRSIAPLSRDTSLRAPPPAVTSQTNLISRQEQPLRSPFEDPQDDDTVSEVSGPALQRDRDDMSVVSDLSYQQDPAIGRPGL